MPATPNLNPIFLKIPRPEFQIWEIPDPENLLGALYQALRGLDFVKELQTMKFFLKLSMNLRSHDHFQVIIYLKNL